MYFQPDKTHKSAKINLLGMLTDRTLMKFSTILQVSVYIFILMPISEHFCTWLFGIIARWFMMGFLVYIWKPVGINYNAYVLVLVKISWCITWFIPIDWLILINWTAFVIFLYICMILWDITFIGPDYLQSITHKDPCTSMDLKNC